MMKILVLGGTQFLGRHVVDAALAKGHEVTLFNRGKTNPGLYPNLEKLVGDRDGGLDALKGRAWDAVVDPSGYVPRLVGDAARLLADSVEHYTFISSISVYSDFSVPNMDENDPLGTLEDETFEEINGDTYGPLKVLCEKAAEQAMPGRVLHVRAGLIVGPHDPTDRFTYWPVRVNRGGEVMAPVGPEFPVQFIDGRDLAEWIIRMAEARQGGAYNVTGPHMPISRLLAACQAVSQNNSTITYVDADFLVANEVGHWMELPLWTPSDWGGMMTVNIDKALAVGLTVRPVEDTVRDTLAWHAARPPKPVDAPQRPPAGLDPAKEARILAAWHART